MVTLYQNREDALRDELAKLINDAEKAELKKAKEAEASSKTNSNGKGANKKKDKPKLSAQVQKKIKTIEADIRANDKLCSQYKNELIVYTQHTRNIFQTAYTKIALRLEVQNNSKAIEALEGSFSFFCPRQTIEAVVVNVGESQQQHQDVWDDSQRVAYVREMCPVMRMHQRPSNVGLFSLPYIKKFHCTPDTPVVVEALLDEMYQNTILDELKSRLKDVTDDARLKVLRHCEDVLEQKTELTTELVRKHYRKKSIRLHPDRNGEENRPIFEEFTDARDVLSDVQLRQVYVTQMLEVFSKIGPDDRTLEIAHMAWNKKHRPDMAESATKSQRDKKKGGAPLALEGVLDLSQIPRGVMVTNYKRNNNDIVKIAVYALQPKYEFYSKVKSIRVEMKSTMNEKRSFVLKRKEIVARIQLDGHRQPILEPLVTVAETSLNPGLWEIVAFIQLDPMGTDILNPNNASGETVEMKPSALMMFDVADQAREKLVNHFETAEGRCTQVYAELSSVVHKLRSNSSAQSKSVSVLERYGTYHNVLVRARQKYNHLGMMMEKTGLKSDIYNRLGDLLHESRQMFSEMQNSVNSIARKKENKCDAKRFKAYVATVLESNDPSTWMKNVSKAELCRNGGSPDPINRLYQLFIEGKGKYTLLFDSEIYRVAAVRDDLFSSKQCKELATRGEEVCLREKQEEEEAIAAEKRKKKEDEAQAKMLKDIEMRHKWGMVGQNIRIQGLTSSRGAAMNNKFAKVHNYMVEKDRFEVELLRTKEKVLLKVDNMVVYYGYIPDAHNVSEVRATETTSESSAAPTSANTSAANGVDKKKPRKAEKAPQAAPKLDVTSNGIDTRKLSKTIYVAASHSKRLTGKKGKKKKDLVDRSGADISVKTNIVNNFVPVHLNGNATAVWKAFALIQESVGTDNVSEVVPSAPSPKETTQTSAPAAVKPPFCPTSTFQSISAPEVDSSISKLLEKSLDKGLRGLAATPETQISSPQYSFGEELLMAKPAELPSEIGITGPSSSKKSSNDTSVGSVSSLNDRSTASRAPSVSAAVKNDQLFSFLKSQQQCIKGSVEDFYNWLVKSEDIDSIAALKEAVVDEEYLSETIKIGNGESGVKGFKRKVFQRAVLDYQEPPQQLEALAAPQNSVIPPMDEMNSKSSLGMSTLESAFLPSNLFGSPDFGTFTPISTVDVNIQKKNEPPPELVCPIELVLMTEDPVLAADGVTYERRAITNWFESNIAKIKKAEEALKINPFSDSDRRVVENGITSPTLGTKMQNLVLTANINVRNMARDFQAAT